MPTTNTTIDKKNKIIGISTVSAIAVVLVIVIVLVSALSGKATLMSNGNLMDGYKICRKTSKITDINTKDYTNFCTKIVTQQVKNGGNTAMSLTDTANTLSFIASTSFGNTRKQIENILCQSAEDTAAMIASIEKRHHSKPTRNTVLCHLTLRSLILTRLQKSKKLLKNQRSKIRNCYESRKFWRACFFKPGTRNCG